MNLLKRLHESLVGCPRHESPINTIHFTIHLWEHVALITACLKGVGNSSPRKSSRGYHRRWSTGLETHGYRPHPSSTTVLYWPWCSEPEDGELWWMLVAGSGLAIVHLPLKLKALWEQRAITGWDARPSGDKSQWERDRWREGWRENWRSICFCL